MKKKTKLIVILIPLLLVVGGAYGGIKLFDYRQTEVRIEIKEKQIAFLKAHEKEMADFVKAQNPKVKSVQFDWKTVKTETVQPNAGGIPTGKDYDVLEMYGNANQDKWDNFSPNFGLDDSGLPIMNTMWTDDLDTFDSY